MCVSNCLCICVTSGLENINQLCITVIYSFGSFFFSLLCLMAALGESKLYIYGMSMRMNNEQRKKLYLQANLFFQSNIHRICAQRKSKRSSILCFLLDLFCFLFCVCYLIPDSFAFILFFLEKLAYSLHAKNDEETKKFLERIWMCVCVCECKRLIFRHCQK